IFEICPGVAVYLSTWLVTLTVAACAPAGAASRTPIITASLLTIASRLPEGRVAQEQFRPRAQDPAQLEVHDGGQPPALDDRQLVLVAGDQRREREEELVDEAVGQQPAEQPRAALAQERADPAAAEVGKGGSR